MHFTSHVQCVCCAGYHAVYYDLDTAVQQTCPEFDCVFVGAAAGLFVAHLLAVQKGGTLALPLALPAARSTMADAV